MPTFTTIALENLLEPRVRHSSKKQLFHGDSEDLNPRNEGSRHLYISPALYATPDQAPLPEFSSPDPVLPSPYLVNLKRRRGGNQRSGAPELPEEVLENFAIEEFVGEDDGGGEEEGFLDPKIEAAAEAEADELNITQFDCRSFVSAPGDFFDAIDEFSSDGSISNTPSHDSIESELRASRLRLLDEIERRKSAEETLDSIRSQWERIRSIMSDAGLTFPALPIGSDALLIENNNTLDQISQEIIVTKFVADAIGRGQARAEAEEAASAIVELKEQQIMRLKDRLQYYETVNHEMSQRKLVDVARKQQERKRSRRRWLWGIMGLSIAIGASVVAYSYIPRNSECLSLLKSDDSTDATSSLGISETTTSEV
ncbi:hypothetical protein ABFS82_14G079100 [Erythranthe guttata]